MQLYLRKYSKHVHTLRLRGNKRDKITMRGLTPSLQLQNLQLEGLLLGLQPIASPSASFRGVLGDAALTATLTQLQLSSCELLDGSRGLAAALSQLPSLQHLSVSSLCVPGGETVIGNFMKFQTVVFERLQRLTFLELAGGMGLLSPDEASPALQPLQALTKLVELRLGWMQTPDRQLTAEMFSGMEHLSWLEVSR